MMKVGPKSHKDHPRGDSPYKGESKVDQKGLLRSTAVLKGEVRHMLMVLHHKQRLPENLLQIPFKKRLQIMLP